MPELLDSKALALGKAIRKFTSESELDPVSRKYERKLKRLLRAHGSKLVGAGGESIVVEFPSNKNLKQRVSDFFAGKKPEKIIAFDREHTEPLAAQIQYHLIRLLATVFYYNFPEFHGTYSNVDSSGTIRTYIHGKEGKEHDNGLPQEVIDAVKSLQLPILFDQSGSNYIKRKKQVYYIDKPAFSFGMGNSAEKWNIDAILSFMKKNQTKYHYTQNDFIKVPKIVNRIIALERQLAGMRDKKTPA